MKVFIFMFVHFIFAKRPHECGSDPPIDPDDCHVIDTKANYRCCWAKSIDLFNETSFCTKREINTQQMDSLFYDVIDGLDHELFCRTPFTGQIGTKCGNDIVNNATDCNSVSTSNNKCCLYNSTNLQQCFWLGGLPTERKLKNQTDAYIITCISTIQSFNIYLISLLIFLFLFK